MVRLRAWILRHPVLADKCPQDKGPSFPLGASNTADLSTTTVSLDTVSLLSLSHEPSRSFSCP